MNFVICVCYNCLDEIELLRKVEYFFSSCTVDKIIIVDTNKGYNIGGDYTSAQANNEYFEFSGYNTGLNIVRENLDEANRAFIINDTIFDSNVTKLYSEALSEYNDIKVNNDKSISGFINHTKYTSYIPTCFFIVDFPSGIDLPIISNVPRKINGEIDYENLYLVNKKVFMDGINGWLKPNYWELWKGWYKANPFEEISEEVLHRKQLAIYLEHSMLTSFSNDGFSFNEIKSNKIILLKRCNSALHLYYKLKYRLNFLLKKVIG